MNYQLVISWLLLVVLPLLLGVSVYPFFEGQTGIIRNHVPDILWAFSLTAALLLLGDFFQFNRRINAPLALIVSLSHECAQAAQWTKGTFDWYDVVVISLASIFATFTYTLWISNSSNHSSEL